MVLIMLTNSVLSCRYWNLDFTDSFPIKIAEKSEPFLIVMDHFVWLFMIFWVFRHRHGIFRILSVLHEIDGIYEGSDIEIDHTGHHSRMMKLLAGVFAYAVADCAFTSVVLGLYDNRDGIMLTAFIFWIFSLCLSFQLHFIWLAGAISMRFQMMTVWVQKFPQNLTKIQKIHLRLVEVIKMFNKIFGQLEMLFVGTLFSWNCFGAFTLTVMKNTKRTEYFSAYLLLANLAILTVLMVLMTRTCEGISEAKESIVEVLYKLRNKNFVDRCEIDGFISQIVNTNVTIGCKIFDFSWKFLFQVRQLG